FPSTTLFRSALRNENFAVHSIDSDGLRVLEPGVRTENFTHRRDVTVGVASESEDRESIKGRHEDLVVNGIISHVVNRSAEQRILTSNCSRRLCTTIRQPGECRNLRMGHSVC